MQITGAGEMRRHIFAPDADRQKQKRPTVFTHLPVFILFVVIFIAVVDVLRTHRVTFQQFDSVIPWISCLFLTKNNALPSAALEFFFSFPSRIRRGQGLNSPWRATHKFKMYGRVEVEANCQMVLDRWWLKCKQVLAMWRHLLSTADVIRSLSRQSPFSDTWKRKI